MSRREQELAHTAGLLHDIGKFALSDRVMERGGKLLDSDWRGDPPPPGHRRAACCATSASTGRSPTSSARTTSGSTAAATRAG